MEKLSLHRRKKLSLSKETLKVLSEEAARQVNSGTNTNFVPTDSCATHDCATYGCTITCWPC